MTVPPMPPVPPGHPGPAGHPQQPQLRCPLCGGAQFQREEARQDSRWGMTSHRMTLMICVQCRYVLHFYDRHSIFDVD